MNEASDVARRAAAHVFVEDLDAPELADEDAHHLSRVLRLRDGEAVTACDGNGKVLPCTWSAGRLEPNGEVLLDSPPDPPLCVGFALTKGEKPEWTVRRLTELGIDVIAPFVAARSVARWGEEKADRNAARLRRVAREAAMQSRRSRMPTIAPVVPFSQVVQAARAGTLALAEPGGGALAATHTTLLVGPEGGWDGAELDAVRDHVSLGETVLRAETAAIAAGVLFAAVRAQIVHANAKSGLSARTL